MSDFEFDELKREFLEEARTKVADMEALLPDCPAPESLDRLAYLAHQLKGSGGSYGYQNISDDAAEIERLVEEISSSGQAPAEGKLDDSVSKLREGIDLAAAELK
ncbi:MAG TPA: Hpt domain-containing protein [Thermoanaerobaculia bacterium]